MNRPRQSQYIRVNKNSRLLKKWIARLLLAVDLEDYLVFERIERRVLAAFRTAGLNKENLEDAGFVRSWLERELEDCEDTAIDETDVFAVNTRRLMQLIGLDGTELAVLRFAILLNCCRPLEMVADIHSDGLSEVDLCDLLHDVLGESFGALYRALDPKGRLIRSGLLKSRSERGGTGSLSGWLRVPEILLLQVFRVQNDDGSMEQLFYLEAPRSSLGRKDFLHLEPNLSLARDYLRACYRNRETGINLLLWGPPGAGKTELARYLAQSIRKRGLEINTRNQDGNALGAGARFDSYCLCQAIVGKTRHAMVIYDEVEEILSDSGYADHGFKRSGFITKGTINNTLEGNEAPAIWVTNTLRGVDPAYLRRFDLVLPVKMPAVGTRRRIARNAFRDLPVDRELVELISKHEDITPAHLQKASKICSRLGIDDFEQAQSVVQQVLNSDLEAIRARPLKPKSTRAVAGPVLDYRPDLINSDIDLSRLSQHLNADSSARICLYGPSGTGKTAWGRHLARLLKRPLLVKRAADIFGGFLGDTENNIVAAFDAAVAGKSLLMLDEVDSFLQDRSRAHRHWEVAQVNQFLTAMEDYDGILICTTNLVESLDPATLRRFDFKIGFDYLDPAQSLSMALNLCAAFGVKFGPRDRASLQAGLNNLRLSHGDFATVFRRYSVLRTAPALPALIADLQAESRFRQQPEGSAIGFNACV